MSNKGTSAQSACRSLPLLKSEYNSLTNRKSVTVSQCLLHLKKDWATVAAADSGTAEVLPQVLEALDVCCRDTADLWRLLRFQADTIQSGDADLHKGRLSKVNEGVTKVRNGTARPGQVEEIILLRKTCLIQEGHEEIRSDAAGDTTDHHCRHWALLFPVHRWYVLGDLLCLVLSRWHNLWGGPARSRLLNNRCRGRPAGCLAVQGTRHACRVSLRRVHCHHLRCRIALHRCKHLRRICLRPP